MFSNYLEYEFVKGGRSPETGFDCYGLVRHVLIQELGVALPNYGVELSNRLEAEKAQSEVIEIMEGSEFPDGWTEVKGSIKKFDVLWLRSIYPVHYGIAISSKDFLHIEAGKNSVIESIHESRWSNKLLGVYRHDKML